MDIDVIKQLRLASEYKLSGRIDEARELLNDIIRAYPDFAAAYNNLGALLYSEGKFSDSADVYQKAIDLEPSYIDAYYNLGLALIKLKRIQEAIHAYDALLALSPTHSAAQFQLATLYMQQLNYQKAGDNFLLIDAAHPHHLETKINLATCYLKQGYLQEAKKYYLQAYELQPKDTQVLFNLGVIDAQLGLIDTAVDYYQQIIAVDPDHVDAQQNLGFIFLVQKNKEAALHHFREVLRLQPHNEAVQHTINILTQETSVSSSPPDYIRSLFDSYADHYDAHLQKSLHYQVPVLMFKALQSVSTYFHPPADILDLGCGTGLCGELFKPLARTLTGVDLSEKMLLVAANRNIYDVLVTQDILTFMEGKTACYDLIMAGDVLVYMGDLSALFLYVKAALRPGGLFIFNTEINEDQDYCLTESGRFTHGKVYLDELIGQQGLQTIYYQKATMRTQSDRGVIGHMYVVALPQTAQL